MILAIFLLFVNDLFVFIADGAEAEVWQCPNTSASELIREIWEENRNLSTLFLDLHPDSGKIITTVCLLLLSNAWFFLLLCRRPR